MTAPPLPRLWFFGFSKNSSSKEGVKPWFTLSVNGSQFHRFSSIFWIFWHFLFTGKLMTSAYNRRCQIFFTFNKFITSRTNMRLRFERYYGRSISQNVALLNILFHDVISLLYYVFDTFKTSRKVPQIFAIPENRFENSWITYLYHTNWNFIT